jgi:hypothetical protein
MMEAAARVPTAQPARRSIACTGISISQVQRRVRRLAVIGIGAASTAVAGGPAIPLARSWRRGRRERSHVERRVAQQPPRSDRRQQQPEQPIPEPTRQATSPLPDPAEPPRRPRDGGGARIPVGDERRQVIRQVPLPRSWRASTAASSMAFPHPKSRKGQLQEGRQTKQLGVA